MKKDNEQPVKNYKQPVMINWYRPRMLLNIGLKAMISGTFGNYADRRELEAALDSNIDKGWDELEEEYCKDKKDIWIDVVNDTGDSFNSTFAIAKSVAAQSLEFKYEDEKGQTQTVTTPRGKLLIFGGDEVYPFPTMDEYENRFIIPYASACDDPSLLNKQDNRPHLYAIPGNHDWYDGLGNFIKLFCQQRTIGIWSTKQHRSYFALPLPNRYWIWATDIQLNSDIDEPQLCYFRAIAQKMQNGDKVILITAEPAWVYNQIHQSDRSFQRLQFFVDKHIRDEDNKIGKRFKLAATLTGDFHHYARYCNKENPNGHQYITAGGGGAFLHLTHNLPEYLNSLRGSDCKIHREKIFPDEKESRRLLLGNFIFPVKNIFFTALFFCIYLLFFWIIQGHEPRNLQAKNDLFGIGWSFIQYVAHSTFRAPSVMIMTLVLVGGFYAFTDVNVRSYVSARVIGFIHAIGQAAILFSCLYMLSRLVIYGSMEQDPLWQKLLYVVIYCGVGSILAALFMGIYLYMSNRLFDMHINEASSSFASPNYKNFLRLHVHDNGLTIYPVGIKKVPKNWKQEQHIDEKKKITYSFSGNTVETFLIENPITILNDKLL